MQSSYGSLWVNRWHLTFTAGCLGSTSKEELIWGFPHSSPSHGRTPQDSWGQVEAGAGRYHCQDQGKAAAVLRWMEVSELLLCIRSTHLFEKCVRMHTLKHTDRMISSYIYCTLAWPFALVYIWPILHMQTKVISIYIAITCRYDV